MPGLKSITDLSGFLKILITILSISIIPVLIISFISNLLTYSYARQNYLLSINESLSTYSTSVDGNIRGLENLMSVLGRNSDVLSFVIDPDKDNYYRNTRIIDVLNSFVGSYDFISSIYLYSATEGIILSSNGGVESVNNFFDTNWIDRFNRHFLGISRLTTRMVRSSNDKTMPVITLISNLPIGSWGKTAGLVVNLNKNELFSDFNSMLGRGQSAYVLSSGGYIIEHPDEDRIGNYVGNEAVAKTAVKERSGFFLHDTQDGRRVISFYTAPYTRWTFVYEVDLADLISFVRGMMLVNFGVILVAVFSIIFISLRISRGMYLPIEELTNSNRLLENARPMMRENIVFHLLHNKLSDKNEILDSLNLIDVNFSAERFSVLVFQIDRYLQVKEQRDAVSLRLLKGTLIERIDAAVPQEIGRVFSENDDDQICVLLNFSGNALPPGMEESLLAMVLKDFPFSVTCGVGGTCTDITDAHRSYSEAAAAVQQKMFLGTGRVIYFSEIRNADAGLIFLGPEVEKNLLSCVKTGNTRDVEYLSQTLIRRVREHHPFDIKATLRVFTRIATSIMEMQVEQQLAGVGGGLRDLYAELRRLETLDEIEDWLCLICSETATAINTRQTDKTSTNAEKIAAYIDMNLDRQELSLVDIGDAVGLSSSYVSRIFKEYYGTNYVDYLNRNRIEKAKEILKDFSIPVHTVAEMAGFSNLQTFIRVFKKYEQLSPGKYRRIIDTQESRA